MEQLNKREYKIKSRDDQLKSLCNNILTLMTNHDSSFSRSHLESLASAMRIVLVPEGKALELFSAKLVSSVDDVVHVDGAADFLPCTTGECSGGRDS